ncbi:MAG: beta-propeller domain-containing protein [Erythrobacter sp.]
MKLLRGFLAGAVCLAGMAGALLAEAANAQSAMRGFASESELKAFLKRASRAEQRVYAAVPPPPPPAAPPAMATAAPVVESARTAAASAPDAPSITNNQTQGVDEGGIVKTHGSHLVVLRRGRLFTIDTRNNGLKTVDTIDAFPPSDRSGRGAWYDEMLITGDLVVVIGFNYARAGTEINRFRISDSGKLTYLDTHHLRSHDYYSSRNYASRLIGTRLVVFTPHDLDLSDDGDFQASLPALRRWSEKGPGAGFEILANPRRIYVAEMLRRAKRPKIEAIHAVTSCDLAAVQLACNSTAVLGSASRNFYVARDAVFVWTGEIFQTRWDEDEDRRGMAYRIPLDGKAPQAVGVVGNPTDQFSFLESGGVLHVLVRADTGGDGMWQPELGRGDLALLRLPLGRFGNGSRMAEKALYQPLPGGKGLWGLQNRYVGGHLLYGGTQQRRGVAGGRGEAVAPPPRMRVVSLKDRSVAELDIDFSVTRIDQMGADAMVIGQTPDNALVFQPVALDGPPRLLDAYALPGTSEGENRSHAYFFRADAKSDGASGTLGLPVARALRHPNARFLGAGSSIFFLRRDDRVLSPAGQLDANAERAVADNCLASCTDWYGNARPIFYGERIFALMGYELVEGRLDRGKVTELARVDFTPAAASAR